MSTYVKALRAIILTWCIEDQLKIVRELIDIAKHDKEGTLIGAEVIMLRSASERLAKVLLIIAGSIRCTDIRKQIDDIELMAQRILRKTVRSLAKRLRSLDIDPFIQKYNLDSEQRKLVMHIIEVSSSRAKANLQKVLSDVYEKLQRNIAEIRNSIRSLEPHTLVSNLEKINDFFEKIERISNYGILTQSEVDMVVVKTINTLLNELNKGMLRISKELGIQPNKIKESIPRLNEIPKQVRKSIDVAIKILNLYAATALLYDLLSLINTTFLDSVSPTHRVTHIYVEPMRHCIAKARSMIERYLDEVRRLI